MKTKFTFLLWFSLALFYGQTPKTSTNIKTIDNNPTTMHPDNLKKMLSQIKKNGWEEQGLKGRVKSIVPYYVSENGNDDGSESYVGRPYGFFFDEKGNLLEKIEYDNALNPKIDTKFTRTFFPNGIIAQENITYYHEKGRKTQYIEKYNYKTNSIEITSWSSDTPSKKEKDTYIFNANGFLIEKKRFDGISLKYNEFGKFIGYEYLVRGKKIFEPKFFYNSKGNLISAKYDDDDEGLGYEGVGCKAFFTYDTYDNLIQTKIYGYCAFGHEEWYPDPLPDYSKPDEWYLCTNADSDQPFGGGYFPLGAHLKKRVNSIYYQYDIKGNPESETRYVYNETGKLIESNYYAFGEGRDNTNYTYDQMGNLIQILTNKAGRHPKIEFSYDNRGNLIETKITDSNGLVDIQSQKYDQYGNIIEVNGGEAEYKYKYKIEYYE